MGYELILRPFIYGLTLLEAKYILNPCENFSCLIRLPIFGRFYLNCRTNVDKWMSSAYCWWHFLLVPLPILLFFFPDFEGIPYNKIGSTTWWVMDVVSTTRWVASAVSTTLEALASMTKRLVAVVGIVWSSDPWILMDDLLPARLKQLWLLGVVIRFQMAMRWV